MNNSNTDLIDTDGQVDLEAAASLLASKALEYAARTKFQGDLVFALRIEWCLHAHEVSPCEHMTIEKILDIAIRIIKDKTQTAPMVRR